jgi:hypothetical protein
MDSATAVKDGKKPRDDGSSVSVCGYCGAVHVFGKGFVLEPVDVRTLDRQSREAIYGFWRRIGRRVP